MILKRVDGHWDVEVVLDRRERGCDVIIRSAEDRPAHVKLLRGDQITIGLAAAEARELARRLLAAADREELATAVESAVETARKPPRARVPFTSKQGKYLAFIHRYISKYGCAPAESDIQRHFLVSAPTVNQMMQRLERLRVAGMASAFVSQTTI